MENMNLYIVVGVLIFMIIMFLLQKATYGVTAMTCVAILVLTGVLDFTTAFSGIINKNTILVATVMVVGNAIGKTSVTRKIKAGINHLKGKSGLILMLAMFGFTILLCQVMGQVAVLTIMFVFVQTLDDDGEVCSSRMLYLIVAMLCAWTGRFPVGMGAALPMQEIQEKTLSSMNLLHTAQTEYLSIGISPHRGAAEIAKLYPLFIHQFPQIRLSIQEGYTNQLREYLKNRQVSLIVSTALKNDRDHFLFAPIHHEELLLAVPPYHRMAGKASANPDFPATASLNQFADSPFIFRMV
jgi:hypothetical protein